MRERSKLTDAPVVNEWVFGVCGYGLVRLISISVRMVGSATSERLMVFLAGSFSGNVPAFPVAILSAPYEVGGLRVNAVGVLRSKCYRRYTCDTSRGAAPYGVLRYAPSLALVAIEAYTRRAAEIGRSRLIGVYG